MGAENGNVASVVDAAAAASSEAVGTPTDAHIATVICAFCRKNLREINHLWVVSCW